MALAFSVPVIRRALSSLLHVFCFSVSADFQEISLQRFPNCVSRIFPPSFYGFLHSPHLSAHLYSLLALESGGWEREREKDGES